VVETFRRQLGNPGRQLEGDRCGELEMRDVVELHDLPGDGVGDLLAGMAGGNVEQAGAAVDDLVAVMIPEVQPLAFHHQSRLGLELPVGGERHPVGFEGVGGVLHRRCPPMTNGPPGPRRPVPPRRKSGQKIGPA
jgi:hypothetical protein